MNRSLCILAFFIISCNNDSVSKEVLSEFDSVSKRLDKANQIVSESSEIVKQKLALLRLTDTTSWRKLNELDSIVIDFVKYNDSLSRAFVVFCGADESGRLLPDRASDIDLSGRFFGGNGNGPLFYKRFSMLSEKGEAAALTDSARTFSHKLIHPPSTGAMGPLQPTGTRFSNAYFGQVPPIAVLTILAKFRNDAETLRSIIFNEYSNLVSSQP